VYTRNEAAVQTQPLSSVEGPDGKA